MGQLDVLQYLHSKGADFFRLDENEESGVHWAARQGHADVIEFLYKIGLSINSANKAGESPLHLASKQGHQKAVEFLCKYCKGINDSNEEDETALHLASAHGHAQAVRCLIDAGVNLNLTDKHGCTALHSAMRRHHNAVAIMLLKAGCHVDVLDKAGEAPIHIACREGLLPIAQTLCAYGCKIEVPNKVGQYPLHIAARSGHTELVRCLCLSGCNVEQKNKDGIAAEITALAQGYNEMAYLLDKLKNVHLREELISQLVPSPRPVPKVKLKLFGHSGVGKSAFVEAFRCGYFAAWFRRSLDSLTPKYKRSDSNTRSSIELTSGSELNKLYFETCFETYTRGIDVIQANVSGVGEISIWEFSGHEPYHSLYDHFVGNTNCLHLVLFSLADPYDLQLMQVRYWMRFLLARIPVQEPLGFGGRSAAPPCVALVGTHAASAEGCASRLLREAQSEFGGQLRLHGEVFVLDSSEAGSPGLKAVKAYVTEMKEVVTEDVPRSTGFLECVCGHLPRWRVSSSSGVLLEWREFVRLVREQVNPLAGEEHMREMVQQLQIMGEVVYIECQSGDLVVLDPSWLCGTILGRLLSQENLERARVTGLYSVEDVQLLFPEADAPKLLELLESLHLCTGCFENEYAVMEYEFPVFNLLETLDDGLWSPTTEHVVYGGLRLRCRDEEHLLESMFSRLQVYLRRSYRDVASPECELYQWYGGSKYSSGDVEGLVTLEDEGDSYEFKVRGPHGTQSDCFLFLEDLVGIVEDMCSAACPEVVLERHYLSPAQLKNHSSQVHTYPPQQVFDSLLQHGICGNLSSDIGEETVLSVAFFDSHRIVVTDHDLIHCGNKNADFQRAAMRHSSSNHSLSLKHERKRRPEALHRRQSLPTYPQQSSPCMQVLHDLYSRLASTTDNPASRPALDTGPEIVLAFSLPASELPLSGLRVLCALLDPPDRLGRDWCMLGILLGLTEKLPQMDPGYRSPDEHSEHRCLDDGNPEYSPTASVIREWASSPGATLGQLLDKLRELERKDALDEVLRTLPMFRIVSTGNSE